jgi:hypothetical protein
VKASSLVAGRRILVVEDDYIVAIDLVDCLRGLGAVVIGPFYDVAGGSSALTGTRPDAAILDVKLGRELVYPLADKLMEVGVPFMFATGFDASALPDRFASCPRLIKPIISRDL